MTDDVDYDSVPVTTEERYDEETKSMRWEILINGWSIGNSSSEASAIERGKWLLQDPGGRVTLRRLGIRDWMLSRTPEEVQQRREAQIAARREEHRKHREQQLREHRERRRQEG